MTKNTRTGLWIAVALLGGVAAGAVGMLSLRGGDGPYASSPAATRGMGAAPASTAFVTAVAGNCDLVPVLPAAGNGDGHETLPAKPQEAAPDAVASRILSGKEAAAAGRQRDAEVDFLSACRSAVALRDGDPVPLADAMYQLGRHYANVAALGLAKGQQTELFRRAERLYSASLEAYRARYGDEHEKTRFAREGLITVQQATGGKAPTVLAKAPATPPAAAAPAAASASATVASAAQPVTVTAPPVAAVSAPAPMAVAKSEAPKTAASQPRQRAPRASDESPAPRMESAAVEHLPAPVPTPVRERAAPRRDDTDTTPATVEEPKPRPRRAPVQESAGDDSGLAEVTPPPPPRRVRPAPVIPAAPQVETPPPDTSGSGAGPASTAEGSPGTQ